MHDKTITLNIILLAAAVAVSACKSNPTISSVGKPAGTAPPGTSSSPSTPASSPSSASGPASTPGGEMAQGQARTKAEPGSASSAGAREGADNASAQAGNQQDEKTDEQILAEALDELAKRNRAATGESRGEVRGAGQGPSAGSGKGAATDAEKTAELDRRLGDQFAKFDDLILAERKASRGDGSGGVDGDFGDGEDAGGDGAGAPLQTAAAQPPGPPPGHGGLPSSRPGNSVSYEPPPDVGQGQDDDIIARQLREAAMKEQDPELRAKLWDEYRKYKKSS